MWWEGQSFTHLAHIRWAFPECQHRVSRGGTKLSKANVYYTCTVYMCLHTMYIYYIPDIHNVYTALFINIYKYAQRKCNIAYLYTRCVYYIYTILHTSICMHDPHIIQPWPGGGGQMETQVPWQGKFQCHESKQRRLPGGRGIWTKS